MPLVAGMYYIFIKDFLDVFPRDQIHLIRTDDFGKDAYGTIKGFADFLDLGR